MGLKQELVEKRNELDAVNKKIAKINKESKDGQDYDFTKTNELQGDAKQRLAEYRKLLVKVNGDPDNNIKGLGEEVQELAAAVKGLDYNPEEEDLKGGVQHPSIKGGKRKTLGEQFVASDPFKEFTEGRRKLNQVQFESDVDIKTLMTTSAGFAPESVRTGEVIPYAVEPVKFFDVIPKGQTGMAAVVYMEQTTRTNNAAAATEGSGALGESAFEWTERSVTVQNIGHWIPVTGQQLEDVPQIQGIIDTEMRNGLREKLDDYGLNGTGVSPVPLGILNKSGIQTQSAGGDEIPDAFYKAMTRVMETGKADPNVHVINPLDWQIVRLMRTTEGVYIWGNPSEPGPMRMWGLPVIPTTRIAQGTGVTGDFANFSKYFERRGIVVEMTDSHDDYFEYVKYAIRATVRGCFRWSRPAAFCQVTDLT